MHRRWPAFFLRALLWSALLFALWEWRLGQFYLRSVGEVVRVIFEVLERPKQMCEILYDLFYGQIPFLALGLAGKSRHFAKFKKLLIGGAILFIWHIGLSALMCEIYTSPDVRVTAFTEISILIFNTAVPLALWIALFRPEVRKPSNK